MHILGVNMPDHKLVKQTLTYFFGVGKHTSHRICARVQIHDKCKVKDLTPQQVTALTAFLNAPSSAPRPAHMPVAGINFVPPPPSKPINAIPQPRRSPDAHKDPLKDLKIESDLKREIRENILHHRLIGSYVGRRHALQLPVRGQNTQSNTKTARRLNRIERVLETRQNKRF
ncbi:mitochondrial 30S ribosomal protein S13 [Trametopsis cervina]|nr:mitochondrial 30S ribosomal protein S13 [Trametopsis cervina]